MPRRCPRILTGVVLALPLAAACAVPPRGEPCGDDVCGAGTFCNRSACVATTAVDDQEMWNPAQNYWEGPIVITGTRDGVPVTGQGYAELTGYASDPMDP